MADAEKEKKQRSPAYPFIPLETAIERARKLWGAENKHPAAVSSAAKHWGYGAKSSGALQTVSALKQYGLLEDVGAGLERKVKLTELAKQIILDEVTNSAQRLSAIKKAALGPKLYAELFAAWGSTLPSDETFRTHLRLERGFNETAIQGVLTDYKDTLTFAKLTDSDKMSPKPEDNKDPKPLAGGQMEATEQQVTGQQGRPVAGDIEPVRIALEGGGIGRVIFSGSAATPDDISALIEVLEVQKRQLERKQKRVVQADATEKAS